MKRRLIGAAVLTFVGAIVWFSLPRDMPFDREKWLQSADVRWASDNPRHSMRKAALSAALRCKTGEEVLKLFGNPDGSADFASENDTDPAYAHNYRLGATRALPQFWEIGRIKYLSVVLDRKDRVVQVDLQEDSFGY